MQDLRQRVLGSPEISTDGYLPYQNAIRDAFNGKASHGVIVKTYSVTNLAVKDAARRYSPAEVVAVEHQVVSGFPVKISTSYVERQNLTLRMTCKNVFLPGLISMAFQRSSPIMPRIAELGLYVAHYNLCRVHEALRTTPAVALGISDRVWTIGDLIDAVLPLEPNRPVRVKRHLPVIEGGKS